MARRSRLTISDLIFRMGTGAFALVLVLIVSGIGFVLWNESHLAIQKFGFGFWRGTDWNPVQGEFGAFPFIWGTLYSSLLALLIAGPVALGIAIFLSELCPDWLRQPLVFLTELLAAIPSIVYGLWGVFVLVPAVRSLQMALPDSIRTFPLFIGPPVGFSLLAAALVLAVMVVPYSSAVAREVLKSVPRSQREASYALGSTRWEATKVALHYGRAGIIGAIMLGFGRAIGETMAVTMVIGNTPKAVASIFAPQHTMAAVIANQFVDANDQLHSDALVEIGLVLFIITLLINIASRTLIWNMTRQRSRASRPGAIPATRSA
jgi:phosphate transport system permease protein